jgi:hypothetical protein
MEDEHESGPGPLNLLSRYALGLSIGAGTGGALLAVSYSEPTGGSSGSSGGAFSWLLALLTITVGGVAVMATWAFLSGWFDTRASRRRGARRGRTRRAAEPREVPYWLQIASTIVGMVTGIVGVVIGLAG